MIRVMLLWGCTAVLLISISLFWGFDVAFQLSFGSVFALALSMSGTFFWLWLRRTTPLAIGMGISWAGTAGVLGWWLLFDQLDAPLFMQESPILLACVSAYFVGALLHFQVIARSIGVRSFLLLVPLLASMSATIISLI